MASDLQTSRRNAGGVGSTSWSSSCSCSAEYIISVKTKSGSVYPEPAECKQREFSAAGYALLSVAAQPPKLLTRLTFDDFRAETREVVGRSARPLLAVIDSLSESYKRSRRDGAEQLEDIGSKT